MKPQQLNIFKNIDKPVLFIYILMVFIGLANIYAAEVTETNTPIFNFSQNYGKQIIFISIAFIFAITLLLTDEKFLTTLSYPLYAFTLFLLIGVLFFGTEVNATKAWFHIGNFAIQPSEFAKFATALTLAKYISSIRGKTINFKNRITPFIIIAMPAVLVFLQNDVGTTLVFSILIFALYREGFVSGILLLFGFILIFLFVLTLIIDEFIIIAIIGGLTFISAIIFRKKKSAALQLFFIGILLAAFVYSVDYVYEEVLQRHHKERIAVLVSDDFDPRGPGYNLNQSKIAIGSGGLWGKGYLEGTQTKFDFVPEQGTDFIFCTVGEEWGFMGSTVIISLFLILITRIILLAEKQRSSFSRIYGYCTASILFFHFAINIGMTIGLVPVIGIPLPFISYGGSSMIGFTILLFIFLKLDTKRLERF